MVPDHPPPSYDRDVDRFSLRSARFSLRSAAPSYTSSIPPRYTPRITYSSLIPANTSSDSGLGPSGIPTHHAYNVASWPSLSNQSQSRAYLNVAARRARRAQEEAQSEVEADALRRMMRLGGSSTNIPQQSSSSTSPPIDLGMEEALRHESRSWDFFTAQMHDWEQRELNWKAFKAKHESKKLKGKSKPRSRWGFYGRLG